MLKKVEVRGDSGHASFAIPISGPQGSAVIHADAIKSAGR